MRVYLLQNYALVQGSELYLSHALSHFYQLNFLKFAVDCVLQVLQMVDLFYLRKVTFRVEYLVDSEDNFPFSFLLLWDRNFEVFDLVICESILQFVNLQSLLSILCGQVVACVDYEIIFALNFRPSLFGVVKEHTSKVNMETHELSERLLT